MANQVVAIGDFDTPLRRATVTADGALKVDSTGTGTFPAATTLADGVASPTTVTVGAAEMRFNAVVGYERVRSNEDYALLASAARTASTDSGDQVNRNGKGVVVVIDATAASATPSVVFTIQGKDNVSGKYYTILASAAVTGISTTVLRVHPGLTAAANLVANDILPRQWRVLCTAGDADSLTYSIGASVLGI